MPDWLWFVVIFVAYIVLMRWVLPRFGVPTWMSGSCGAEDRRRQTGDKKSATNWFFAEGLIAAQHSAPGAALSATRRS